MRAAMEPAPRFPSSARPTRSKAFGSCRLCLVEIEGRARHSRLVHDAGRRRHEGARPQTERLTQLRTRRDGALHLRSSARLPDLRRPTATASCRTWPARSACATCATATTGDNHLDAGQGRVQPLLHLRSVEVHRLLALRARLRRSAGHVRADHPGPRLRLPGRRPSQDEPFLDSECVSCGACVQACPTATLQEKSVIDDRPARTQRWSRPAPIAASAARFKAEMQRRAGRAHGARARTARPTAAMPASRAASPGATPPTRDRITKPMIRETIDRAVARGDLGRGDRPRRRASSSASRPSTAATAIGGITSSRCTNEETFLVQKLVRAAFGNNNVDTCARVCHSPTGYGLKTDLRHLRRHAGLRLGRCRPTSSS